MKRLLSIPLDITDEVIEGNLEKVAELVEPLTEEAKSAYIPSLEEQEAMDDNDFAAVLFHPHTGSIKKYANYNKDLTELNLAILASNLDKLPDEVIKVAATNLTCAANNFDLEIPELLQDFDSKKYVTNLIDVRDISEKDYLKKTASTVDKNNFALENQYPLDTEEDIIKAATYFDNYSKDFSLTEKTLFAINTLKAANENDVSLNNSLITKYANKTSTFNPDFYDHIQVRKSYVLDSEDELLAAYDEILKEADDKGTTETIKDLYELDKKANLCRMYDKGIEDPVLATLNTEINEREIDGVLVKESDLHSLPADELSVIVGSDGVTELHGKEALDVFASLPKPIREEIRKII